MDKVEIMMGIGSPFGVKPLQGGGGPAYSVGIYSTGSVKQESRSCTAARLARLLPLAPWISSGDGVSSDLMRRVHADCVVSIVNDFSAAWICCYET